MAVILRKAIDIMVPSLVASLNSLKRELALNITTLPHADITSQMTSTDFQYATSSTPDIIHSANATDLPSLLTLINEQRLVFNRHLIDADAHQVADSPAGTSAAVDLPSALTLVNGTASVYTTHAANATVHFTVDTTNALTAPTATDLGTAITLANQLKTVLNAHIQFGFATPTLHLVAC